MKRRRVNGTARKSSGGSVTGGTGDIKPQNLTVTTGVAGAIDDYVFASIALPVPRFGGSKNKATIFEFLWVDWYIGTEDLADITGGVAQYWAWLSTAPTRAGGETSTLSSLGADLTDPRAFAPSLWGRSLVTSGAWTVGFPRRVDMTDSNGNGFLVATDRLVITCGSVSGALPISATAKIAYRLVDVGIEEYVGIVQSQTGIA